MKAATKPLAALHRERRREWERSQAARAEQQQDEQDRQPREPQPALYVNDATLEALADVLIANARGVLYLNNEMEGWLGSTTPTATGRAATTPSGCASSIAARTRSSA